MTASSHDTRGADATRNEAPPGLSARLRTLRQARGLSLSEVAEGAGISASFLSLVETGKSDITIGRLTRLVSFYGVSVTDLLPRQEPADAHVVRRGEGHRLHSEVEEIDVSLLTPDTDRAMMPMLLELEPGAARAEHGSHPPGTEEFLHVISGELVLELEGSAPRRLRPGDSAYYPGDHPHLFRNASRSRPLRVLCVDTPPVL